MAGSQRIKGGEKNEKSGKVWTEYELEQVVQLYIQIKGKGLHEHNPLIIELGKKLNRTTRSVEAQLIMFRSKSKGTDYGYKNMNKLIQNLWNKYNLGNMKETFNMDNMEDNSQMNINETGIEELFNWASHRKGGVKIAFTDRGTPTGNVIKTNLINGLDQLINDIKEQNASSAIKIFLIGGPGNGKTEALDYFIKNIIFKFNLPAIVLTELEEMAKTLVRSVDISVSKYDLPFKSIRLIPDASIGEKNVTPAASLINELDIITDDSTLYICCINRGILHDALERSTKYSNESATLIFKKLTELTINSNENIENTWPIKFKHINREIKIAVWPMEISSLLGNTGQDISAFASVINKVIEFEGWEKIKQLHKTNNINSDLCPLLINHNNLSKDSGKALNNILAEYECITGKKFTFREILSLSVYSVLGHETDFKDGEGKINPVNYVINKLNLIEQHDDPELGYIAMFNLAMLQIEFKLFGKWPNIAQLLQDKEWEKLILRNNKNNQSIAINAFQKIFTNTAVSEIRTDLEKTLQHAGILLDPSKLFSYRSGDHPFNPSELDIMIQDSVESLSKYLEKHDAINELDRKVIQFFNSVEIELNEIRLVNNVNGINKTIERLNIILKKITAAYVKRKIAGFYGVTYESSNIEKFSEVTEGNDDKIRGAIENLLQIENRTTGPMRFGRISAGLNSTFGQPSFDFNEILFDNQIQYDIKLYKPKGNNCRQPIPDARFLKLDVIYKSESEKKSFLLPFTFNLYSAIDNLGNGLKKGTMPRDIVATFDRMKSFLEGVTVHSLPNESKITFPDGSEFNIT